MALVNATFWYSVKNVTSAADNDKISFSKDPALQPYKDVVLPDGIYQISQITDAINAVLYAEGLYTIVNNEIVYAFEFRPNVSTQRVDFILNANPGTYPNFTVDVMKLGELMGWPANTLLTASGSAPNPPNITNGVDTFLFHCDTVNGNASFLAGRSSNVIASYSITNLDGGPGSLISVRPQHLIFLPVAQRDQINQMRFWVTDQSGRPVDFGGERVTASLQLRFD